MLVLSEKGYSQQEEEGIFVMDWLAQSPSLNPIENMWNQIKALVQKQNPSNLTGLWTSVNTAWKAFSPERLSDLIGIRARGMSTKY